MIVGRWRAVAACLVLVVVPSGTSHAATIDPRDAAVEIWGTGCSLIYTHGSGVALGGDLVATAAHVVAGATEVAVASWRGERTPATIIAIDTQHDAAVLRVPALHRPALRRRPLVNGEHGRFFGFGITSPKMVAFTVVRAVTIDSEDIYVHGSYPRAGYDMTTRVVAGDSGSGLIADDGSLGGIVWATSTQDDNRGWGISISVVEAALATVGPKPVGRVPCG